MAAAAALASLDLFAEEDTLAELQPKIARLGVHLSRLATHPHVADARQTGLIAGVELSKYKDNGQRFPPEDRVGWQVCQNLLDRGVWIRPLGDVLVVLPPLAVSMEQLDHVLGAIWHAVDEVTSGTG
jgi:adenosylmethionine-8-amino-7-oxononanoate aminotransferase